MAKVFWAIVLFLILGGYLIKTSVDTNLDKPEDQRYFLIEYGSWVFQLAKNAKGIAGYVVKQDWLPESYVFINDTGNETNELLNEEEDDS